MGDQQVQARSWQGEASALPPDSVGEGLGQAEEKDAQTDRAPVCGSPGENTRVGQVSRPRANCGSDHELIIAKFRLKLNKLGKTLDHSGMT